MDGIDQRAMGRDQEHPTGRPGAGRWTGPSVERPAHHAERHVVDIATGAPWKDLPERYGPHQTAHRRFQNWVRSGVMEQLLLALAKHLQDAGGLDLKECFVDGTFVPAKKGGDRWEKPSGARAPRSWALQTALVFLSPCGQKALRQLK